jgi:hypothetical protein
MVFRNVTQCSFADRCPYFDRRVESIFHLKTEATAPLMVSTKSHASQPTRPEAQNKYNSSSFHRRQSSVCCNTVTQQQTLFSFQSILGLLLCVSRLRNMNNIYHVDRQNSRVTTRKGITSFRFCWKSLSMLVSRATLLAWHFLYSFSRELRRTRAGFLGSNLAVRPCFSSHL